MKRFVRHFAFAMLAVAGSFALNACGTDQSTADSESNAVTCDTTRKVYVTDEGRTEAEAKANVVAKANTDCTESGTKPACIADPTTFTAVVAPPGTQNPQWPWLGRGNLYDANVRLYYGKCMAGMMLVPPDAMQPS